MRPLKHVSLALACVAMATAVGCATTASKPTSPAQVSAPASQDGLMPLDDRHIMAFTTTGFVGDPLIGRAMFNNSVAKQNPWEFKNNGRSCASCHIGADGFGLGRQSAFNAGPNDPLIAQVLADGDPDVDFNSPYGQKLKKVMLDQLRECGLIRIVQPNPNFDPSMPAAEDHPEDHNNANPRLIRTWRAVPTVLNSGLGHEETFDTTSGEPFKAFIMWDGREPSLEHQAASATMGHAQTLLQIGPTDLRAAVTNHTGNDIARFERDFLSSPRSLARKNIMKPEVDHQWDGTPFEGAPVFDMATVQKKFFSTVQFSKNPALKAKQLHGMQLFVQNKGKPACITCHNLPETLAGGTRLFDNADISEENSIARLHKATPEMKQLLQEFGFELDDDAAILDAHSSQEPMQTERLPKFKVRLKDKYGAWHVVETPDLGLAGHTGRYEDLQEFKIPQLRGVKGFTRFFHENHDTLNLKAVVQHYDNVLPSLEFSDAEQNDVVEFLKAL